MNITPFQFENRAIRVVTDDSGEPWFIAKEVADVLGYSDSEAMTRRLDDDEKQNRQIVGFGPRGVTTVNESGLYSAILGSTKPEAKPFKRWVTHEVLPSIRKTGSYTHPKASRPQTLTRNQVAASILLLRSAAEDLKLAPSAVLGGYQRLEAQLGVAGLLPSYAIDAPGSASVAGSSEVTKALGELLDEHGVGMSAIAFNRLLMQHGVVEERERPSSKGGTKKFKVIVDLEYGKNATHPSNPRETQPLWYPSKFAELLALVLPAKPAVVASRSERSRA